MSTILNTVVKTTIPVCIGFLMALMPVNLHAQCKLSKKVSGHTIKIETPDNYQYIRSNNDYLGISTHTVLLKKPTGNTFYLVIKYTGSASVSHMLHLTFRFKDSVVMESNLRLIKTQKTDNIKLSTKVYEASLSDVNLTDLQQKQLIDLTISFSDKKQPVSIPVNDAAFMLAQIACLQQELK